MSEIKNGRLGLYGAEHSKFDYMMTLGFKELKILPAAVIHALRLQLELLQVRRHDVVFNVVGGHYEKSGRRTKMSELRHCRRQCGSDANITLANCSLDPATALVTATDRSFD